jgi:prepilin-type N-terminal cleavage/methylation domain-containing protein
VTPSLPTKGGSLRRISADLLRSSPAIKPAFTLVEMLVVLGIIVVLISIFLPVVLVARRSSRSTVCANNLRELGHFFQIYALANAQNIPLGVARYNPPDAPDPNPWFGYHTMNNSFIWLNGAPSSAMGPFLSSGMIKPQSARIFFCPLGTREWDEFKFSFDKALGGDDVSIRISYAVRPVSAIWIHNYQKKTVTFPSPMPRLDKMRNLAIVAEYPQYGSSPHGSENAPAINALYANGSVRLIPRSAFIKPLRAYLSVPPGLPAGYETESNHHALNEDDPHAESIWHNIDVYN